MKFKITYESAQEFTEEITADSREEAEEKIDAAATTTITNTATEEPSPAAPPTTAVPSLKEVVASLESTLLTSSPAAAVTVEPHRHSAAEEDALLAKYLQRLGVPGAAEGIIMEGGAWVRRDDGVGDDRGLCVHTHLARVASCAGRRAAGVPRQQAQS